MRAISNANEDKVFVVEFFYQNTHVNVSDYCWSFKWIKKKIIIIIIKTLMIIYNNWHCLFFQNLQTKNKNLQYIFQKPLFDSNRNCESVKTRWDRKKAYIQTVFVMLSCWGYLTVSSMMCRKVWQMERGRGVMIWPRNCI